MSRKYRNRWVAAAAQGALLCTWAPCSHISLFCTHKHRAYTVGEKKKKKLSGGVHAFFFLSVQYSTKVCSQTRFQGVLMYYRCVSFCLAQRLCDERVSTKKR
uniref:Putative secreted protein n=1 Tax=Ixodes scapularis TaxID=6945 RepID=A0A4D5RYQ2_IXOSC